MEKSPCPNRLPYPAYTEKGFKDATQGIFPDAVQSKEKTPSEGVFFLPSGDELRRTLPDSNHIPNPGRNRETADALYGARSTITAHLRGQTEVRQEVLGSP
jgi:hypothetical protein